MVIKYCNGTTFVSWEVMLRPEGLMRSKHPPAVYGALLKDHYVMDTFHFHWGLRDYRGSEHSINGVRQVDRDTYFQASSKEFLRNSLS
jgi:hypothetical protein